MGNPVKTRLVLSFPGFEPVPVEGHRRRFERESAKAAPAYDARMTVGDVDVTRGPVDIGVFDVEANGDGWQTQTEVVFYGLSALNAMYDERPLLTRLFSGFHGYADFLLTGTFFRYGKIAWRYLLFVLYPVLVLAASMAAAWTIMLLLVRAFPVLAETGYGLLYTALTVMIFMASVRKLHLMLFIDDWTFSRDLARGLNPEVEKKLAYVMADARRRVAESNAEEILLVAHSFGASTGVLTLADMLAEEPAAKRVKLMTVGSSLLKFALHPAGKRFRDAVKTIVAANTLWLDVQSVTDPLHCYGSEPAKMYGENPTDRQTKMKVSFRRQLSASNYNAIRRDIYRVHRQYVYGVERQYRYSFHMILCGPETLDVIVARPGLVENQDDGKGDRGK